MRLEVLKVTYILLVFLVSSCATKTITEGQTMEQVRSELGKPNHAYANGKENVWLYDGDLGIIFRNKKVSHFYTAQDRAEGRLSLVVAIDALGGIRKGKRVAKIQPSRKELKDNDLEFLELASYLQWMLSQKGYTFTDSATEATELIFLDYSISAPRTHTKISSSPIYEYQYEPVGRSATTTFSNQYGQTLGSATTTYNPSWGGSYKYQGERIESSETATYIRRITVEAIARNRAAESLPKQQWRFSCVSEGSSDDLRRLSPLMLTAGFDFVGTRTSGKVELISFETDPRILEMTQAREVASPERPR